MPHDIVSTATRTLVAAGFSITRSHRQPHHIEIHCERESRLGACIHYLIAITGSDSFTPNEAKDIRDTGERSGRAVALVAGNRGENQISWRDFLEYLGGAVPSWRALSDDYEEKLLTVSRNALPNGMVGEAWSIFEDLVADGFEYSLGRKVQRYGGHRRGLKVSDMVAQIPDETLLVIDAKAAEKGFDVGWDELRPLIEYVRNQKQRQRNLIDVRAAVIVSSSFMQQPESLERLSRDFLSECGNPLCYVTAETLAQTVKALRANPFIRSAVRWRALFTGKMIQFDDVEREIMSALDQSYRTKEA